MWKIYISTFTRFIAKKLGRLLTLGRILSTQTLKSSPMSCFTLKKNRFFKHQYQNKLTAGISWLVSDEVCIHIKYFFGVVRNKLQTLSSVSCESALNFDQRKTSEHYKPLRVWLWLVYKFTENYCRSRLFSSSFKLRRGILPLLAKYVS